MVDNMIEGVYGNLTRINPETLSPEAKQFLKLFREDLSIHRTIDKNLGNLVAKSIINYHNEKGESVIPLIVEIITVSYFAIERFRNFAVNVTEFVILGTIFASLTITEDEAEITDIIEQLMVAIFTNPIYEFDYRERYAIERLIYQSKGYITTLNFYSGKFNRYMHVILAGLKSGLLQALEICNVSADELNTSQNEKNFGLDILWGRVKFYLYLAWPMFNLNTNSIIKWLNKKTGIELWPVK